MSRGATARLFVAVDPPAEVCDELAAWARAALGELRAQTADVPDAPGARGTRGTRGKPASRGVRLLRPQTMHVTLCFLGSRPIGEIETIAQALQACWAQCPQLHVGAPLWLPPRRPRSLALEVDDRTGELARLQARVRDALGDAIDWQPERRRFRGHVTVARIGRGRGGGGTPLAPTPRLSFAARELVLYRSLLSREGASYEALATRELRASEEPSPSASSSTADDGCDAPARGQANVEGPSTGAEPSSQDDEEGSSHRSEASAGGEASSSSQGDWSDSDSASAPGATAHSGRPARAVTGSAPSAQIGASPSAHS